MSTIEGCEFCTVFATKDGVIGKINHVNRVPQLSAPFPGLLSSQIDYSRHRRAQYQPDFSLNICHNSEFIYYN